MDINLGCGAFESLLVFAPFDTTSAFAEDIVLATYFIVRAKCSLRKCRILPLPAFFLCHIPLEFPLGCCLRICRHLRV